MRKGLGPPSRGLECRGWHQTLVLEAGGLHPVAHKAAEGVQGSRAARGMGTGGKTGSSLWRFWGWWSREGSEQLLVEGGLGPLSAERAEQGS